MITLKSPGEINKIRKSCLIVADILERLKDCVQPGVSTMELNDLSEQLAKHHNAKPAFKGYQGYPQALCASINEEVVHGIPSHHRYLKEGDIVSLDFGVVVDGYYGDAAITVPVGKVSKRAVRLCRITEQALYEGIKQVAVGNHLSDISHAIQQYAENHKFSVVREFVGHGIGRHLHESPQIPNFGPPGKGVKLKVGMVFAIEPMINEGGPDVEVLSDQWTAVTLDRKLSAHFEHTVAVTENGPDILSCRQKSF